MFLSFMIVVACAHLQAGKYKKSGRAFAYPLERESDTNDNQYRVTINLPTSRALSDQVQGGGKYSDGETVSLYTTETKFTAEATGSAGGKWLSDAPQSRVTLTSGINQDWSVTIKDYYCNVTFDNTSSGGDGTIETVAMKFGEQLPSPTPDAGYVFEGWYDGAVKVTKVPDSPNITITGKFETSIIYYFRSSDSNKGTIDKNYIKLSDYRDVEGSNSVFYVTPTEMSGCYFYEWGYILPNENGEVHSVLLENVDRDNCLFINNAQYLENYYPAGTEFIAYFKSNTGEETPPRGETETPYHTITFKIAEWNSGWKITPGYYCLSWTQTWSSDGPTSLSKTYKKGETCTIYWASSSFEPVAIRDSNHNLIEYFSGTSSYSFKVTGDVTYYIEMVEYRP